LKCATQQQLHSISYVRLQRKSGTQQRVIVTEQLPFKRVLLGLIVLKPEKTFVCVTFAAYEKYQPTADFVFITN
jgi:hypothetical protein